MVANGSVLRMPRVGGGGVDPFMGIVAAVRLPHEPSRIVQARLDAMPAVRLQMPVALAVPMVDMQPDLGK